jgi:uncharacterized sulfatase
MQGINLLDVCHGKPIARDVIFGESFAHDIADINDPEQSLLYRWCIEGHWKLLLTYDGKLGRYAAIHASRPEHPQLFDLQEDPFETKNLAADHPEIVKRLTEKIDGWWKLKQLEPRH